MSWERTTELADNHETPEAEGKFGPLKKKKNLKARNTTEWGFI